MKEETKKILWINIKSAIKQELLSRGLKNPKIRLGAIENLEGLIKAYFNEEYRDPVKLLKIPKDVFIKKLGHYKDNAVLNSAEQSIINNIYDYLESNTTTQVESDPTDVNEIINSEESNLKLNQDKELVVDEIGILNFKDELDLLKEVFGKESIEKKLERLNEIHKKTEELWKEQLKDLPGTGIKYLLIAEAPPWSAEDEVTYVYNPNSKPRTLLKALCRAFFDEPLYNLIGSKETLKRLAAFGLIIVDSIPFAMDYSSKRNSWKYDKLISQTVESYMLKKINRDDLNWDKDLKVAFAFKINGQAIIKALKDEFRIKKLDESIKLSTDIIVANDAGYPDSKMIKKVFGLSEEIKAINQDE